MGCWKNNVLVLGSRLFLYPDSPLSFNIARKSLVHGSFLCFNLFAVPNVLIHGHKLHLE
jgi:hypothetical protein